MDPRHAQALAVTGISTRIDSIAARRVRQRRHVVQPGIGEPATECRRHRAPGRRRRAAPTAPPRECCRYLVADRVAVRVVDERKLSRSISSRPNLVAVTAGAADFIVAGQFPKTRWLKSRSSGSRVA